MKLIYAGAPAFSVPPLAALRQAGFEVLAVLTQPDKPVGRKGVLTPTPLKAYALQEGIPVLEYAKVRDNVSALAQMGADALITCAYGQILSKEILDIPRLGVLNVHGSLLPLYRGSAPIQRALMNGDKETGITIMKTDVGMDSGDILSQEKTLIDSDDYVEDLYAKLSVIGARLLLDTIDGYESGKIKPVPQNAECATYAPMLKKEEAYIDFSASCEQVRNVIRGMGYGVCLLGGTPLKIFRADLRESLGRPGEILVAAKDEFVVACGTGALAITDVQASGKKRMKTADFLNGMRISAGEFLARVKD